MSVAVTHQQRLSMQRAEEGRKALQEKIADIDKLLELLPTTLAELALHEAPERQPGARRKVDDIVEAASRQYDAQKPIKKKFVDAAAICERSLLKQKEPYLS